MLLFYKKGKKIDLSMGFYIALWGQILLGILIYSFGFQEPRLLLTLSAVLNAGAMMMSFPLIYLLNRRFLIKDIWPGVFRKMAMLVAFIFFVIFVMVTARDFAI
jgi:hypothetical protein